MDPSDPPLTLREQLADNRARGDLLKEERLLRDEKRGPFRTNLAFAVSAVIGCTFFYAMGDGLVRPMRDLAASNRQKAAASNPYGAASALFAAGDLEAAAEILKPLLQKYPSGNQANLLMAKIELSRQQPSAAIKCLEMARETALDRREIEGWIADLKTRLPAAQ